MSEPFYDFSVSTLGHVWAAYRLMQEGGGSFRMQLVTEEDVAFIVQFVAPYPLTIRLDGRDEHIEQHQRVTIPFTFNFTDGHEGSRPERFARFLRSYECGPDG